MLNDYCLTEPSPPYDNGEPLWMPRSQTTRIPCGRHFDAIRIPAHEAQRAHEILGPASGPVLASHYTQTWHFLLDLHAVTPDSWNVVGTRLLRPGTLLGVPPAFVTHGRDVRWVVLPGEGTTSPDALQHALTGHAVPVPGTARHPHGAQPRGTHPSPVAGLPAAALRSAAERTRLTPTEVRVAERLVAGLSNITGGTELHMSPSTFGCHLTEIGRKFDVTTRPARAHAVLASSQVTPPPAPTAVPDFTEDELRLLRALAEHSTTYAIAKAAGVAQAEVRSHRDALVEKAGADNDAHLIGLAHAWGLLGAGRDEQRVLPAPGGLS